MCMHVSLDTQNHAICLALALDNLARICSSTCYQSLCYFSYCTIYKHLMLALCKEYKCFIQIFLLLSYMGALWILFWLASIPGDLRIRFHLEKWVTSKSHHPLHTISKEEKVFLLCKGNYLKDIFTISHFSFELYPALILSLLLNGLQKIGKYGLKTPLCPLQQITVSHTCKPSNIVVCGVLIYSSYCKLPLPGKIASLIRMANSHWTFALALRTGLII